MRSPTRFAAMACLLGLLLAPAPRLNAQDRSRPSEKEPAERAREEARLDQADPFAAGLDARIAGRSSPADFRIDVSWPTKPDLMASCRIWGDGVGLWNRQAQFRVDAARVVELMKAVRRARFGTFPSEVGEEEGGEKEIRGRITVTVGDVTRSVAVIGDEKPDEELEELARAVLVAGEPAASRGVRIGNLREGLEKLAAGTLSPEVFEVLAQRTTDHPEEGGSAETWLLVVSGRQARDRVGPRGSRPLSERVLRLSAKETSQIVALLLANDVGSLPKNLPAAQRSRLRVQVLNRVATIEARHYSGKGPAASADARERFDRLWGWCEAMHRRVESSGRSVATAVPTPGAGETAKDVD